MGKTTQHVTQWFSTGGGWRPTKQNGTQFGDPYCNKKGLYYRFWRLKTEYLRPKSGSRPTC